MAIDKLKKKKKKRNSRWVRNSAYEQLGPFMSTLKADQVSSEFLKYYTSIPSLSSTEADNECFHHCAFNFPGVVLTLGQSRWVELYDTFDLLVHKAFKSRKTLAHSIHDIANILGTQLTEQYLLSAIDFFLKDVDDVRVGVLSNFWKILRVLGDTKRKEYLCMLWELGSEPDINWRIRLLLAELSHGFFMHVNIYIYIHICVYVHIFLLLLLLLNGMWNGGKDRQLDDIYWLYEPEQVMDQLVPLAFQLCDDRMAEVRCVMAVAIAELVRFFQTKGTAEQLQQILAKCYVLHSAKTYSKRLLFVLIFLFVLNFFFFFFLKKKKKR
ncbi:protein phosphatase 4 regulatory subunit 1 [Reticulomyxa filosa]|uniref:Protein phosphatase 4 regulatory subunit 1 n=1 Tax=Reticulomyxa filosa TaxID=46433 RepID=X6MX61_RETFI|nr:protein phosphatase 4 regulatory subunit 1 [Reticulomyxa filosa]|eukprot:ETO18067.1 protein phosphatase 4 regulatory subunit 1 [Reticulomyxa filosa]